MELLAAGVVVLLSREHAFELVRAGQRHLGAAHDSFKKNTSKSSQLNGVIIRIEPGWRGHNSCGFGFFVIV